MATAASSPLASSVEKTNGAKLSRVLIDGGSTVLRKIFDGYHPRPTLAANLNANKSVLSKLLKKKVLHKPQWDKLFPPGGVAPDSNSFDITLLFLLLTNICGLTPPPSGWHTKPPPSDTSSEANLARVKHYRNVLYGHVTTTGVDTPTFSALWTEISGVLVSLGLDRAEVDRLKAEKGGEQDYIDVLIEWDDSEEDIKSQLKNIHQVQSQTHQAVEDVRQAQAKTQKTVEELHKTQTEAHQNIEGVQQTIKEVLQSQLKTQHTIEEVRHQNAKNTDEVAEGLKEMKETVESSKKKRDEEKADEVLRNLAKSEFKGDIEYHVQRFQEGTREWVFARVQNWLDDRNAQSRVIIISGNAGMGKSVIAAVICKRMQEAGKLSGCHFCQYNNVRYCKPQLMIQSLACYLSHVLPEYKQALVEQLSRNVGTTDLNNMGVEELFALLFKEPLSAVSDPGRNMLMVIDGLDESEYKGRNELLNVIANQFCKLPVWIRFLVTTRPASNITQNLKYLKPFELTYNDGKNIEDVRVFFQKKLEHVVKLGNLGEFVERLVLKSEGLMLYAHFLVLLITENPSIFHEGDLDDSLPLGISSFYHSYFKRLESELCEDLQMKEEHFLNLLSAVATSREPLPVGFVSKLLVPSTNSPLARRKVLRALNSLSALFPVRDYCLHVIHKSVQDWLTNVSSYGEHEFIVDENEGHRLLAALCTDELENLKLKGVHNIQFSATERYALYHGAYHMLHKGVKKEPHKLDELTKTYIIDLEIVYVKTCLNCTLAAEDLAWLTKQGIFTLLSKDNQSSVNTLLFLLRKNLRLLPDTPRRFLQTILNQGGTVLTVDASNLLRNKYPEIPYMEVVHKETQHGGVVARFDCSSDVLCLDVSSQLDYMVCECWDGMLQLWSLLTGGLVWTRPVVVEKSPKQIVTTYKYEFENSVPSVHWWSFFRSVVFHPTMECILPGILSRKYTMDGELKPLFPGSNCRFSVCSISGDKTKILTNCLESSKCLILWSLESGSVVNRILLDEDILSFAWSDDGGLLAISHSSGVISLYDVMHNVRTLTQMGLLRCGLIKFSPDHGFILCADFFRSCIYCFKVVKDENNRFSLTTACYDSKNFDSFSDCGFLLGDLFAREWFKFDLVFRLDKQRLLLSSKSSIKMVDTKHVNKIVSNPAHEIALSLDGQTVFVSDSSSVTAYDVSSAKPKATAEPEYIYRPHTNICPVKGGVLMLRDYTTVELWSGDHHAKPIKWWISLPGVKKLRLTQLPMVIQLIPISEERVAVVREADVTVLDTSGRKVISTIPVLQGTVLTCNSKCQPLIIKRTFEAHPECVGPDHCSLQLLDGETVFWEKKGIVRFPSVKAAAFSPMEQFLVVCTADGISVLDPETGNTLRTLRPSFSDLQHCTFISDDTCVTSDSNLTVQLFNVKSGELLTEIDVESDVTCLAACPFNRVFAIGLNLFTPNFKVIRVRLPRGEDRANGKR